MTQTKTIRGDWIGEKEISKNTEVVILCHKSSTRNVIAFDVLVRKSIKKRKPRLYKWLKENEYKVNCDVAKLFLRKHKGFEYVFSQDFAHTLYFNVGVLNTLLQIARKFRTTLVLFEEVDEDEV